MIELDSCCGNCLSFCGEDICGYGFCDEKEVEVYCQSCCPKWKRNTDTNGVAERIAIMHTEKEDEDDEN